ncbi:MAG TPA: HWE histidine kinase domain-containing protein [Caulobacteraceae bacterium]|jgi:PAS domain S-box-containing protein|nr:HWE histidine kinase domain-containing protein [Caulobacteraceae bacterium]
MNRIETNSPAAEGSDRTSAPGPTRADQPAADHPAPSPRDRRFDRIVRLAARRFSTPSAALALIEQSRPVVVATFGLGTGGWPCAGAGAEAALARGEAMFVGDVRQDHRWIDAAADLGFYAATPVIEGDGRIVGALCVFDTAAHPTPGPADREFLADLAALAAAMFTQDGEIATARNEARLDRDRTALALGAAGLAGYEWDMISEPVQTSDGLPEMIGWDPARGAIDKAAVREFLHPEDRDTVLGQVREQLIALGRYTIETRIVRPGDAKVIWVSSAGAFVAAEIGPPHRVIGVIQDITDRKTEEEQRETLVAELDHRVKNVLATVQSVAAQSARKASSLEGFLKTFAGRLKSMASAHQLLTATRWRGAGMHNIAAAELGGLAPGQTRWSGPDVLLTPRGANAMSLALHELATNAVKFGALSTEVGRVEVTWRRTADGGLELQWLESHGPAVATPTRRGFGATLLERVTGRELGGSVRVDYRSEGVRALLTVGPTVFAQAPAAEQPAEPEAAPPPVTGASAGPPNGGLPIRIQGLKLLIVEDALLLALELEAGLSEAGAEVLGSAADVGEAMRMVSLPIDAAVLDANLNGASVLPVAQALSGRGIPFVFATGYGDDKMLPAGFDAPVIRKPYDVTQVAAALSAVVGRT